MPKRWWLEAREGHHNAQAFENESKSPLRASHSIRTRQANCKLVTSDISSIRLHGFYTQVLSMIRAYTAACQAAALLAALTSSLLGPDLGGAHLARHGGGLPHATSTFPYSPRVPHSLLSWCIFIQIDLEYIHACSLTLLSSPKTLECALRCQDNYMPGIDLLLTP